MPGKDSMNGLETAKRIKEDPGIEPDPKIIMVSAYGREDLMRKSETLDLAGYLIKPVRESTLYDAIMQAFGKEMSSGAHSRVAEPERTGKLAGARILLVEDNEINQQVAQELMEDAGMLVTIANHGQEALKQLQQDDFDGILMDMQMPVMDGITATKEIRKQTRFKSLHIIAMTANAMKADRDLCLAAGMNDHIAKPIDVKTLFQILERWIQIGESRYRDSEQSSGPVNNLSDDAELDHNLPELPGINLQQSLERLGNNAHLYRQIFELGRRQYSRRRLSVYGLDRRPDPDYYSRSLS